MCQKCIDNLQEALDGEMLKPVPGNIIIHLDDGGDVDGRLLTKKEVEAGLHESWNAYCWCHPLVIRPGDTRTAEEICITYFQHGEKERLT